MLPSRDKLLRYTNAYSRLSYDPVGRNIRTDMPDGTFLKTVFDAWKQENWDANDNTQLCQWYVNQGSPNPAGTEPTNSGQRAAWLAAQHAATPQVVHFDNLGRPFRTDDDNKTETVTTKHQLDIAGNQAQMTDALGRQATTNHYNLVGQVVTTQNIDSGTRTQLHNAAGQPFVQWDSRGNKTNQLYDNLLRPTQTLLTTATQTNVVTEKTEYGTSAAHNSKGKPVAMYAQDGKTVFDVYDFKGNTLQMTKTFAEEYTNLINWNNTQDITLLNESFTEQISYDALNRPLSKILPDNTLEQYAYNKAGLLETVKNNNSFYIENINYNAKGQRTLVKFGNGTETLYFYDNKTFRLIQLKTIRTTNGTSLQDLCYTYDPAGNVVEIVDQAQETSYYGNSQIEPRHLYVYDALYRLLSGTGRELLGLAKATAGGYATDSVNAADAQALHNFTQQFEYDALGNILEIQHVTPNSTLNWTRQYVYDTATNRLLKHDTQQTLNDYTYDAHGNITSMPHLPQMQWTFDDKLKEVTLNAGGDKAYYVYDSAGNRTRKVVEKGIIREERFYLNNYEVYRKYSSNTLTIERTTAHVMDDKQRIASIDHETGGQTTVRYQVNNHLGSSSIELNESGVILTYEEYHPFGTTAYQKHNTNISQKRYKYVGKERDEETGLYNYGFRFYAPWLCRFVSVDLLQHKYPHYTPFQYAGNKPITFIDLDGLEEYNKVNPITAKLRKGNI